MRTKWAYFIGLTNMNIASFGSCCLPFGIQLKRRLPELFLKFDAPALTQLYFAFAEVAVDRRSASLSCDTPMPSCLT